jgi:hypothetical protein
MAIIITTSTKYLIGPFENKGEVVKYIETLHPNNKILYTEKTITILKETLSSTVGFALPSLKEIEKYTYFEILTPMEYKERQQINYK